MPTQNDNFDWWKAALAGNRGPIHDGEPQSGFYRQRRQDKTYEPVAYWKDTTTGEQRCHVNGRAPTEQRALEMWPYVSKNPITAEQYWHRIDTGEWNDVDQAAADTAAGPDIDPATDPAGSLRAEIAKAKAGAGAYASIDSDELSAKAQTLRSALTTLAGKAEAAYEAENRPLLDKQKALRETWFPLRDDAKAAANTIKTAMQDWEDVKRENAKKAAAELQQKQEEQAKAANAASSAAPPANTAAIPAPATQIKGGSGRTASVGTKRVITSIDLEKCWQHFGALPEVYQLFKELAEKRIAAGLITAADIGAVIEEKANIR